MDALNILDGIKGISIIRLDNKDVIRHSLVTKIISAYERHSEPTADQPSQLQD